MASLLGGRAAAPDPLEVLETMVGHGQAHAVVLFGWRAVAALLVGADPAAGQA